MINRIQGGEKPEGLIHTPAQGGASLVLGYRMPNPFRILSHPNLPVFVLGVQVPDGVRLFKSQCTFSRIRGMYSSVPGTGKPRTKSLC